MSTPIYLSIFIYIYIYIYIYAYVVRKTPAYSGMDIGGGNKQGANNKLGRFTKNEQLILCSRLQL
jgi:hypothetical protein